MENKINIAELLKDCPQGIELYSPIFGEVYLDKIRPHLAIVVTTDKKQGDFKEEFLYDGRYGMNGECMLFPSKDQQDWSKFHRPFEDRDVISNGTFIAIFHKSDKGHLYYHCWYNTKHNSFKAKIDFGIGYIEEYRYASKEEKQILFDVIKANSYKWNSKTNTLEKLIVPKFKAGDKIKEKNERFPSTRTIYNYVEGIGYSTTIHDWVRIEDQDEWELVSNKFDINTLKPFDKVLVRDTNGQVWRADLFSHIINKNPNLKITFVCVGHYPNQCIPFKNNEYLLGTSNDCNDFYKTWE